MQLNRRSAVVALGAMAVSIPRAALAQPFPARPLKLIVPFPPGGPVDTIGRVVAQFLGDSLGQPVLVENRSGAGGSLGSEFVARAAADGYTLLFGSNSTLAVNPSIYKNLSYDPQKAFQPIAGIARGQMLLAVNAGTPFQTFQELLRYARTRPGALNYSSPGNGTTIHLAIELLKRQAKFRAVHIPYRGGGPSLAAVAAGDVQFTVEPEVSVTPMINAGKLRPLAVVSPRRSAKFPDLPSMTEAGFPEVNADYWMSVMAPKDTARDVVDRLYADIQAIAQNTAFKQRIAVTGAAVAVQSPLELASTIAGDSRRWADVVSTQGIKAD